MTLRNVVTWKQGEIHYKTKETDGNSKTDKKTKIRYGVVHIHPSPHSQKTKKQERQETLRT